MADYDREADIHFNGVIFTRAWYLMLEDERVRATCLPQLPAGRIVTVRVSEQWDVRKEQLCVKRNIFSWWKLTEKR